MPASAMSRTGGRMSISTCARSNIAGVRTEVYSFERVDQHRKFFYILIDAVLLPPSPSSSSSRSLCPLEIDASSVH